MKQLEKSDLKIGEIYVSNINGKCLFKYLDLNGSNNPNVRNSFFKGGATIGLGLDNFTKATPEEKHWLETCIKADKFVSYEEAIKTFIPEYVECINWKSNLDNPSHLEGVIYKVLKGGFIELNPKYNGGLPTRYFPFKDDSFKPSTKEAYDAQFVAKKPEFVLPEIWWVRITEENLEDVCKFLGFTPYDKAIGNIAGMCKHYRTGKIEKGWNGEPTTVYGTTFGNEITTEQFRKYVLKEEPVVYEEPKDTVLQFNQIRGKGTTIVQVQCSEGGVYKIGDKITVFDKTSPNKGKPFTIQGFRWNNTKTKLCAVTELHTPNGIGLDKIELYVEPKKELSLLEQAKLKYPIGTKYIPTLRSLSKITEISSGLFIETPTFILNGTNYTSIYNKNTKKWAEIVEDFVLPEKWCIKDVKEVKEFFENYNYGNYSCRNIAYLHYPKIRDYCYFETIQKDYTEITLEQFKKYVLNEKV